MNWIVGLVVVFAFLGHLASLVVITWAMTKTTWEAQRRQAEMESQLAGRPHPQPEPVVRQMPYPGADLTEQTIEQLFDSQVR